MKKHLITLGVVVLIVGGLITINHYEPQRLTERRMAEMQASEEAVSQGEEIEAGMSRRDRRRNARGAAGDPGEAGTETAPEPEIEVTATPAETPASPGAFKVRFECTNGTFVAEFNPEWAPIGVAHVKDLIENKVYDGTSFFRVIEGFMAQFGIPADPTVSAKWSDKNIQDEPVRQKNTRGMITFAKSGAPNSRSTQLFISFGDNSRLDRDGFAPVGRVIEGMEVVDALNAQYGGDPSELQMQMKKDGYAVLNQRYPNLDHVKTARIISDE